MLEKAVNMGGADIFFVPGAPVEVKVNNDMIPLTEDRLMPDSSKELVQEMYRMARRDFNLLAESGDDDFSFAVVNVSRFRCNAYHQRGTVAAICRIINFEMPDPEQRHIPPQVMDLAVASSLRREVIVVESNSWLWEASTALSSAFRAAGIPPATIPATIVKIKTAIRVSARVKPPRFRF